MLIDVTLPQLGESVNEGTISKWLVREGDLVKKDQPLVSIATDKADSELPAPAAGSVTRLLAHEGPVVPGKTVTAQIDEGATAGATLSVAPGAPVSLPPASATQPSAAASSVALRGVTGALATPTVRKTALEHDVDLSTVQGTGVRGRVTRDDVIRAAGTNDHPATAPAAPAAPVEVPAPAALQRTQQLAQLVN